jgi:hypothetical protein
VRYLSIFFELKFIDRTNPESAEVQIQVEKSDRPVLSGTGFKLWSVSLLRLIALQVLTESLILAQNERWRRG